MEKKIKKFILMSCIGVVSVCIIVFVSLTLFMSKKTKDSVTDIGEIYMSEVNNQLEQKFDSIVRLRLDQVEGIIEQKDPESMTYNDEMLEELKLSAQVRSFTYLGLYSDEGEEERVIGNAIEIKDYYKEVVISLEDNKSTIALGIDESGEKYLMLIQQASYPLKDGSKSKALIAGVSMQYLNDALYLDQKDALVYSHIIDSDGTFVIRNSDAYRENYFDRLNNIVDDVDGKTSDYYANQLKKAIDSNKDYSADIFVEGDKRRIFCSPITEYAGWYLITVMPSGVLENTMNKLGTTRTVIMVGSSLIILFVMTIVLFQYYRLSQQQIEELNKARQEAIHANNAKSEFLSSMSHDIRTPMNGIIGMTEIALKNMQEPERVEDCLKKVKLSSKHLLGLINDVLDMSKIESGKMTLCNNQMSLKETMDDIVNIMQPQVAGRHQCFDIFIEKIQEENVYCDSIRLNQVLFNILSNAIKFTPENGRIDVYLYQESSPLGDKYVRTHFRIVDTGIGMSEEFQKKIFDSFSREETDIVQNITGTGLGMSITKSIVDLMGGKIELHSEQGKGTEFHIILDFEKAEGKLGEMALPPWNMLVVDDNEQLCLSAVSNLEELGVHTEWTLDGRKAVEMIEERHKKDDDYNFVLLDWKMPNMDGIQTLHEIRKRVGNKIPIFIISAYDWSEIEEEAKAEEIKGFISKPLFKSTLFLCLRQYVEGSKEEFEHNENAEVDFSGKRILLSEDIDLNYEIANEILSSVGLEIERAENGQICVDKFEQSEVGYYDLILMDIRMPVMDGYDATKAIRALRRDDSNLPIIAMTADAFSDDVQRSLDCGMNAHLAKPLDIKECMRTLQQYLG